MILNFSLALKHIYKIGNTRCNFVVIPPQLVAQPLLKMQGMFFVARAYYADRVHLDNFAEQRAAFLSATYRCINIFKKIVLKNECRRSRNQTYDFNGSFVFVIGRMDCKLNFESPLQNDEPVIRMRLHQSSEFIPGYHLMKYHACGLWRLDT